MGQTVVWKTPILDPGLLSPPDADLFLDANCPDCQSSAVASARLIELAQAATLLIPEMEELQAAAYALQQQMRWTANEMRRATVLLKKAAEDHLRCANCGIKLGPGHASSAAPRRVEQPGRFCPSCDKVFDRGTRAPAVVEVHRNGTAHPSR